MGKFASARGKTPAIHIRNFGYNVEEDYNEINLLETDNRKLAKVEYFLAKNIGGELAKCYPKREWSVYVDIEGGIIRIGCDDLSWDRGHVLHIKDRSPDELKHAAKMAGGEILERFNVSRAKKFDIEELDNVVRDFRDEAVSADAIPDDFAKALGKY